MAVLLTATDVDGDPLTYTVVNGPTNGTLSGAAPNLTYTPNASFTGSDSFTFKANDGTDDSNIATVSITVNEVAAYQPGLWFGQVSGNINTTTPNPNTQRLVNVASKTEDGIGGNTTEIYTGEIYDADGHISFTESIDDKARIWIDGQLVLSDNSWNNRTSTGDLALAPGWHSIEIRISNGNGGSGPYQSPGIGFDPSGGANWQTLADPGDGSMLRSNGN